MAPREVNDNNAREVWDRLYNDKKKKKKRKSAFKVGDKVRLNKITVRLKKGICLGGRKRCLLCPK